MKLNWFKVTRMLLGYLGLLCGYIIAVILIFSWNFKDQDLSSDISDWASFGDFFGGVLNSFISFFSLVLLGTITWLIAYKSDNQNLKLNLLQSRMEAFASFTKSINSIENFYQNLYQFGLKFNSYQRYSSSNIDITEFIILDAGKFDLILEDLTNCKIHVESMNFQYSHLFDYDFGSDKYVKIVEYVRTLVGSGVVITTLIKSIGIDNHTTEDLMNQIVEEGKIFYDVRDKFLKDYMNLIIELKEDMNNLKNID